MTCSSRFQSTRPYGARQQLLSALAALPFVSIHTPVWGATFQVIRHDVLFQVSIHAPVWGATGAGCRRGRHIEVSIHAPVWGATSRASLHPPRQEVSIHAPVWGATTAAYGVPEGHRFQSTRPYGARPARM